MKIGVFTVLLAQRPLAEALDYIQSLGLDTVEIGTGNYPSPAHCPLDDLLADEGKLREWKREFENRNITISALSCHGNPIHPREEIAGPHRDVQRKTILLAEKLGLERVITFSGCPGGSPQDTTPNWVTCPWPDDFTEIVNWQWKERVIPYWKDEVAFAKQHGVNKICLEMHPGFVVYNPETLLKMRDAVGDVIGANFDPSHFFWQGIDAVAAIRKLAGAIYHFHAKDSKVDPFNAATDGVLDTKHYGDELHRAWIFRTVGWGHDESVWRDMVSNLRLVGYDDVLSIEHEDSLMSVDEGLKKAVAFLKGIVIQEKSGAMWWA